MIFLLSQLLFSQNQTITFNYTGGMQTWTVPPCVNTITITAAGAKGGGANGGNGALINGTISVTPGQVLNIFVGGMGTLGNNSGGYNGGGTGFASTDGNTNYSSWGGGGASDVRIGGTALANRIIVAGGGGGRSGGSSPVCGGAASSASCIDGGQGCSTYGTGALGGTQFAGGAGGTPWAGTPPGGSPGSLGQGGQAGLWQTASGGGGGGGYYGGGGGGNDGCCTGANGGGGGGGGSSLLPPGGTCSGALNATNGFVTITYTPGFTVSASNTGPYCPGATIQLDISPANLPVGTTYNWTGPGNFSSSLPNPTISTASASNAGSYSVTVTAPGCSANASTLVILNPTPTVNAGTDQTICLNNSTTLNASGATNYIWSSGVTNGVAFFPPLGTTTYTVTGSSNGCSATDEVTITVAPLPSVNAGNDSSICAGQPITLNASSNAANTLTWTNGVINGSSFIPGSTTTYTVTATSPQNCVSSDNIQITVNPLPAVWAGADQTICQGTTITLSGLGAAIYQWNNGVTNGVSFSPPLGSTTYTVTGFTAQNCSITDDVIITVQPSPSPVINGATEYCQNSSVLLTTTENFTTYSWSNGSNGSSISATQVNNPVTVTVTNQFNCSATSAPFTVTQLANFTTNSNLSICQGESATIHGVTQSIAGTYTATFQTANGCDSTSNVTLSIQSLPPVNAGLDQTVCEGSTVTLSGAGAANYLWNNGVSDGVSFIPPLGTSSYTLTGTDANNCQATDLVTITVNATPIVNAGTDITICTGESVNLTATGATTYTWDNNVTNGQVFIPTTTTLYTVTGSSNGCTDTDDVLVSVLDAPTASISGDGNYCEGETANPITVNVGSGFNSYNVTYSVNGQVQTPLVISGNSTTITPPETVGSYEFQLISVSSNGQNQCSSQPIDSILIQINPNPVIDAGEDLILCEPSGGNPDEITLQGSGGVSYVWSNGVTNGIPFIPSSGTTTYTVTGTDANGCSGTDQVTVNALPLPDANGNANVTFGHVTLNTTLENLSSNATQYVWHFGNGDSLVTNNLSSTTYIYTEPGIYLVELVASNGICQDTWTQEIEVIAPMTVNPPNVFTPNGDGSNDSYFVHVENGATFYGIILNRWGNKIAELTELNQGWDGSVNGNLYADGVYFIEYRATDFNGNEVTGHTYFHLVR